MNKFLIISMVLFSLLPACQDGEEPVQPVDIEYTMPEEGERHEGTWLQWPHEYQYGTTYRNRLDATWVAMTKALVASENVHLIAYNETEKARIIKLLEAAGVALDKVAFRIYPTDDVWVRDNGPIYVRDKDGQLLVEDWGFNGWGGKADAGHCNKIPEKIAADQGYPRIDLNSKMVMEGGSVELDGHGTLMACKSSILNKNRNAGMTPAQAAAIFKKYLGATHVIWLDGVAGLEITDMHIDGFARFGNANTIVTMSQANLLEWELPQSDIDKLYAAKNKEGVAYQFLKIPLTQNEVVTEYGKALGYKGSYINYYIANTVVLVPNYQDPNDSVANSIIQSLYPDRKIIGIDVRNLYEQGGMVHCVTQQQPL